MRTNRTHSMWRVVLLDTVYVLPMCYCAALLHIPADHEHQFRFNVNTISGPM